MKNQKGITLIALVITIIVLLILAGVAIAMLQGDNGILTKAKEARDTSDAKDLEEATKLAIGELMTDSLGVPTGGFTTTNVTSELIKKQNSGLGTVNITSETAGEGQNAVAYLVITNDKSTVYVTSSTGAVSENKPEAKTTTEP